MIDIQDIVKKRKAHEAAFARQQVVFFGVIQVGPNGTTEVPNTPDHNWVQPNATGDVVGVFNQKVKGAGVGRGVVCGFEAFSSTLEILRLDNSQQAGVTPVGHLNVPDHAVTHLIGGEDPLPVYENAIFVLLTYTLGLAGLVVNVSSYVYESGGALVIFPGAYNYSLAGHEPAAGLARWVLIYLDLATNALATVAGPVMIDSPIYTPTPPAAPENVVPSALVRIAGGQTIVADTDIVSVRDFLYGQSRARAELGTDLLHRIAVLENEMDKVLSHHLVQGF